MDILTAMRQTRIFFDGAMGTMLQDAGLPAGRLPDLWCLEQPEQVKAVHAAYLRAGSRILKTNTFGANGYKLGPCGVTPGQVAAAAVDIARRAIAESGADAYIALDTGPTGKLLKPYGDLEFEDAVSLFAELMEAGAGAGADCVLIETMSDTYELKAAVLAAKEHTRLPVFATLILDETGRLLTGGDIPSAVALLEGLGVDALGLNCGMGPAQMASLAQELLEYASTPVIVSPNAGLPRTEAGVTVFDVSPEAFAGEMAKLASGVHLLGGCCGTTPAHIASMVKACRDIPLPAVTEKKRLLISSYGGAVAFDGDPVIIGERINPTGKKRLQQALREEDMDFILREGLSQQDAGAQVLDVNVGLPGLDEKALLCKTVQALQSVTALPLQLDTSDPHAMEAALRLYNGKPLLNSVTGKQESLDALLPLVKKYGGGLICLTLDEDGIPETAEGRVAIAGRIAQAAEAHGIPRRELLMDALTLPVSAGGDNGSVTLEALRRIKAELGLKTVLGVSNVSFGLPRRETVNTSFFTLALNAGLDGAIINPMSEAMMVAYSAFLAVTGRDLQCARYLSRYGGEPAVQTAPPPSELTLKQAIVRGLREQAAALAKQAAGQGDVMAVIQAALVPALDAVGSGFEQGKVFLPQLLMSAEAAKAAFDALKDYLPPQESVRGPDIILATVKGDIHDIGKNIVKVLLENYRFHVIDLGKDVPPEVIVRQAVDRDVKLVGLSALMTTTAPYMAETIRQLAAAKPDCRVMVGGAVLTQEYADAIGAHCYSRDAMGAVHYAQTLFRR